MKSKSIFTKEEADEIVKLIRKKLESDSSKQVGIRNKIRRLGFYASEFGFRGGYTVEQFLSVAKIEGSKVKITPQLKAKTSSNDLNLNPKENKTRQTSDESYIIDLCDEVLNLKGVRQHCFDFLRGDAGNRLPVDAWYPSLNLVIEYRERQHTETVKFFDKRQTVSGMGRGEQRKLYDQRRRDVLPQNNIKLIEIDYSDFEHTKGKKLVRNIEEDLGVIIKKVNDERINMIKL